MRIFWSVLLFLTSTFFTICLTIGILQIGFGTLPSDIASTLPGFNISNKWDYTQYYFGLSSVMSFITNYGRVNENLKNFYFLQPFNYNMQLFLSRISSIQVEFQNLLHFDFSGDAFLNLLNLFGDILLVASDMVWCTIVLVLCIPTYIIMSLATFFSMLIELISGAYNQPMYPNGMQPIFTTLRCFIV